MRNIWIVLVASVLWGCAEGRDADGTSVLPRTSAWPGTWLQSFENYFTTKAPVGREDFDCESIDYRKSAMTLLYETKFSALFEDLRGQTKFEASGVESVNDTYFTIFDSLDAVAVTDDDLHRFTDDNRLVGDIGVEDSEFEGIAYYDDRDTFLLLREAVESQVHEGFHPHILEVSIPPGAANYTTLKNCIVDFYISHGNKGFEEIQVVKSSSGDVYVLGLCEGNHCKGGSVGRDRGNGRIVVLKEINDDDGEGDKCKYICVKVIDIPGEKDEAYFQDYSGMDMNGSTIMISSQEDSAIWFGTFNFDTLEIDGTLAVYEFPRSVSCEPLYCNIEGIAWIDNLRIVATSDKAKSRQPWSCTLNDQSIHQFMLPKPLPTVARPRTNRLNKLECLTPDASFSETGVPWKSQA